VKYLVDTHILLWAFIDPEKLSSNVSQLLINENNDIYYSPINLLEISIKYGLKKLDLKAITPEGLYKEIGNSFFICKEINNEDLITFYKLPKYHKDPFDRFLIWEAIRNDLTLLSVDRAMELYEKEGLKVIF
jgi:PIN domain nuclease of toxin-antitoxin system